MKRRWLLTTVGSFIALSALSIAQTRVPISGSPEAHVSDSRRPQVSIPTGPVAHAAPLSAPLVLRGGAVPTGLGGFYDYQSNGGNPAYLYTVPGQPGELFATYMNSSDGSNVTAVSTSRTVGYAYSSDGGATWVSTRDIGQMRLGFPAIEATDGLIPWIAAHGSVVDPMNGPFQTFAFSTTAPDAIQGMSLYGAMPQETSTGRTGGVMWPMFTLTSSGDEAVMIGSYNNDIDNAEPPAPLQTGILDLATGSDVSGWSAIADSTLTVTSGGRTSISRSPGGKIGVAYYRFANDSLDTRWGIYYTESTDNGRSWSQPIDVLINQVTINGLDINGDPDTLSADPNLDLAFNGEEPQVVFTGNINGLLQFESIVHWSPSAGLGIVALAHQEDFFGTYTLPYEIRQPNMGGLAYPTLSVADDGAHMVVAFQAMAQQLDPETNTVTSVMSPDGFGYYRIWASGSSDGGQTWGTPFIVQDFAGPESDSASVEYPSAAEHGRMVNKNFVLNLTFQARRFPGMFAYVAQKQGPDQVDANAGPINEVDQYFQQMQIGPEHFPAPAAVPMIQTDGPHAIPTDPKASMAVYPNVTDSKATVRYTYASSGPVDIRVFNSFGEEVYARTAWAVRGTREVSIDLGSLPQGAYNCMVTHQGYSITAPLHIVR